MNRKIKNIILFRNDNIFFIGKSINFKYIIESLFKILLTISQKFPEFSAHFFQQRKVDLLCFAIFYLEFSFDKKFCPNQASKRNNAYRLAEHRSLRCAHKEMYIIYAHLCSILLLTRAQEEERHYTNDVEQLASITCPIRWIPFDRQRGKYKYKEISVHNREETLLRNTLQFSGRQRITIQR